MYEFERNKLKALIGEENYEYFKAYKCFLAGGAITSLFCNREINDLDIYFRNREDIVNFFSEAVMSQKIWIITRTKKALLYKCENGSTIQLIYFKTFDSVEKIFDTFDFAVCMGAYDFEKEDFVLHENFLKTNSQRILTFNPGTAFPLVSAIRVQKYKDKGYSISKLEYLRILLTCMNLHINNYEDLKEQLGGMYGIEYDEIIKPLEDEEFDIGKVVDKMSQLIYQPEYFKKKPVPQSDVEPNLLYIKRLVGGKIDLYEFNEKLYLYEDNYYFENVTTDVDLQHDDVNIMPISDLLKPNFKLYKVVNKVNDRYFSNWDSKFEYVVGEVAIGRGKSIGCEKYTRGIFGCLSVEAAEDVGGFDSPRKTIIELEVESSDDILDLNDRILEVRKAKFIKEIPVKYEEPDFLAF